MKINLICGLIYIFQIYSCGISHNHRNDVDENLGHGYYLFKDGAFTCIVYTEDKIYKGTGSEIVPFEVTKYAVNNDYIIAISFDNKNNVKNYWIIDTRIRVKLDNCDFKGCDSLLHSNLSGPIDSISFYEEVKNRHIMLNGFEN